MTGFLAWCAVGAVSFLILFLLQTFTKVGYSSELWERDSSPWKIFRHVVFYVLCGPITAILVVMDLLSLWLD